MRIARYTTGSDPTYGLVTGEPGEEVIEAVSGDPLFGEMRKTGRRVQLDEVRLLAPVIPRSKVIGIGKNYPEHAREMGAEPPATPLMFLVPNTAVIGPDDPIVLPQITNEVDYEGELAVVIGAMCKNVPAEKASEVIAGYMCANDVTARDLQRSDGQWARAKGFDTSCPLGPFLVTDIDPGALAITTRRDGEIVQQGNTKDMSFGIAEIIEYASAAFTLLPGDVILTGSPQGVGRIEHRNMVEVEIEGLGTLRNPVIRH